MCFSHYLPTVAILRYRSSWAVQSRPQIYRHFEVPSVTCQDEPSDNPWGRRDEKDEGGIAFLHLWACGYSIACVYTGWKCTVLALFSDCGRGMKRQSEEIEEDVQLRLHFRIQLTGGSTSFSWLSSKVTFNSHTLPVLWLNPGAPTAIRAVVVVVVVEAPTYNIV